jgi:4-hydroxyphenylpyruvate dioxygenase
MPASPPDHACLDRARRRCIATVCLAGPLEERLAATAAAGFDGVEVFAGDLAACARPAAAVGALARDLGLAVELLQPFRDAEGAPPGRFGSVLRRMRAAADRARRLGAPMLLICSSVAPDTIDDDGLAAAQLRVLADLAAERGLRLAYEALAWGRHVRTWQRSWDIVARAAHPALGLGLDSFHVLARGGQAGGIAALPGDRIFFVQLADARRADAGRLAAPSAAGLRHWARHRRLFPLQGDFDLPGFAAAVRASGYGGPVSLEVFNDEFLRADPRRTAAAAMRSLLRLENAVRGSAA